MDFRFRAIDNKSPAAASTGGSSPDHHLRAIYSVDSPNSELVRQRIKEEIMIREIASRRMLEAEIRRELIIEQELAMHRATSRTEGLAFDGQFAMRLLDQRLNHIVDQSSRGLLAVPGSSSSLISLPVGPFPEPQKQELKPLVEEKDNLIFLPKPDPEKFEAKTKRKAEGPPAEADTHTETAPIIPSISLEKPAKEEFTCKVCKITTTSEITLNTHLKGKKHRAKQGQGHGHALQTAIPAESEEKGQDSVNSDKKATEKPPSLENNGSFKFWCEICQIGTRSMVVMATHYKGKKHRARLLKLGECKLQPQGT